VVFGSSCGRCCAANQQACVGRQCCNPDQSCISVGQFKGTCCPDTATQCNNVCCPGDSDICIGQNPSNEICCPAQNACGTTCCQAYSDTLSLSHPYCTDAARGLCCEDFEVETDGICCKREEINCGGVCCAGTCGPGNQCISTSAQCLAQLGNGQTCVGDCSAQCDGFAACRNGCCYDNPK
jgi:hypothetical protein